MILAISLISFRSIALTLGVSLYFGLYSGKHDSKGKGSNIKKRHSLIFFLECATMNSSTSPFPGKYFENVFENQSPIIPQTHRIQATWVSTVEVPPMMSKLINWDFTRKLRKLRTGSRHGETIKLDSQYSITVRKLKAYKESLICL